MSRKAKLYLSKSNAADVPVVNKFMAAIRSLDVTYNEYKTNEKYTHESLIGHDYIIILPPELGEDVVGRGQYEQIRYAFEKGIDVLFVNDVYLDEDEDPPYYKIEVSEVKHVKVYDSNDWTRGYGLVNHNDSWIDLYNYDGILPKPRTKPMTYDPMTFEPIDSTEISPAELAKGISHNLHKGAATFNDIAKKLGYGKKRKHRLSIIKLFS